MGSVICAAAPREDSIASGAKVENPPVCVPPKPTKAAIRSLVEVSDLGEFRAALKAGELHLCGNCRHFTFASNPRDAGTCSKFGPGLAPFALPFYCIGFERSENAPAPEYCP